MGCDAVQCYGTIQTKPLHSPWRWRQQSAPKFWYTTAKLQGVKLHITSTWMVNNIYSNFDVGLCAKHSTLDIFGQTQTYRDTITVQYISMPRAAFLWTSNLCPFKVYCLYSINKERIMTSAWPCVRSHNKFSANLTTFHEIQYEHHAPRGHSTYVLTYSLPIITWTWRQPNSFSESETSVT
jgi:hypothetical protein